MTSARMRLVAPSPEPATPPVGEVELRLLLEGIWSHYGFLALGSKETVRFRAEESRYQELPEHIFRRIA